jgi:phosphoglycolate phosphatase-like HAD superfamily hydrolase
MAFNPGQVQAVLFDVDGTLADTDDEYIRRAARLMGPLKLLFPRRDPTTFLRRGVMMVESPMNALMVVPDWLGIDDKLVALGNWLEDRRPRRSGSHFVLMAGARELLATLAARYPLGLITARPERPTLAFIEQFGLQSFFRVVASAQTAPHTKPYADPVLWAARELGLAPENCLMVGDTTVDILAGKRAGAQTVGVLCGFGERAELERCGASLILPATADLAQAMLQ